MQFYFTRTFILAAFVAGTTITMGSQLASGQATAVSPREFMDTEMPGTANVDGTPSYRLQQVYSRSDFAHLGAGPYTITRIDWTPPSTTLVRIS